MYGYWRRPNNEPTQFGQAMQQSALYDPTTSAVTRTYVEEATTGIGTANADWNALQVKMAEESGVKISEEEYKNNPELYSEGVSWYEGMTKESARISKDWHDAQNKRAQILQDASTGQAILGFVAGFGAGVVEPKNLAIGLGTAWATAGLSELGVLGNNARRMYQLRKTASLANKVKIGAVEGVAAGVVAEPSNRYSAKTLQQDYTLADSAFNVFTSTAFGAWLPAGVHVAGKAGPFMQAKIEKFRGRAMDVAAAELDLATTQLHTGQRVDVSAVEAHEIGNLTDKPIVEQAKTAERFVRYTETPEFKTRFEGSKVVDADGKPLMVYHGTSADFSKFSEMTGKQGDAGREAFFFTNDPREAAIYARESAHSVGDITKGYKQGENIRPTYIRAKNPMRVGDNGTVNSDVIRFAKSLGHDAVIDERGNIAVFSPDQIISAFGADDLPTITKRLEAERTTTLQKANAAALDYLNDPLIDYDAIDAMDERRAIEGVEKEADIEAKLKETEAEIQAMLDQDIINEADLKEYQNALADLNEAETLDALETLRMCMGGL